MTKFVDLRVLGPKDRRLEPGSLSVASRPSIRHSDFGLPSSLGISSFVIPFVGYFVIRHSVGYHSITLSSSRLVNPIPSRSPVFLPLYSMPT